jgi:hypothetical protein
VPIAFVKPWFVLLPLAAAAPILMLVLLAAPLCLASPALSAPRRQHVLRVLDRLIHWTAVIRGSNIDDTKHRTQSSIKKTPKNSDTAS